MRARAGLGECRVRPRNAGAVPISEGLACCRADQEDHQDAAAQAGGEPGDAVRQDERQRHGADVARIPENELQQLSHARACRACEEPGARASRATARPARAYAAKSRSRVTSPSGQAFCSPTMPPSPQKLPKDRMAQATTNLSVFSGTRVSGVLRARPPPITAPSAATALPAAAP